MNFKNSLTHLILGILVFTAQPFSVRASENQTISISENRVDTNYPNAVFFTLEANSDVEIIEAELSIRTDEITCGESVFRVYPEDFETGTEISVHWAWSLRVSGPLPPGTRIQWEWKLTDSSGNITSTPPEEIIFEDQTINWREYNSHSLTINYYEGSRNFAQQLANAGEDALDQILEWTGVDLNESIQVYVYPSSRAMQDATLFAPSWSGGMAFSNHRIVLIAVGDGEIDWGRAVLSHEITHVVIDAYIDTCIGGLPRWMNEGIAEYIEATVTNDRGGLQSYLDEAIQNNSLISVQELEYIFSNDPDLARLAYAESRSLVEFLIETYGQEGLFDLLNNFSEGFGTDYVLMRVIGMNQIGLEQEWRSWLGAPPLIMNEEELTGEETNTPYPTFAPLSGPTETYTPTPTETLTPTLTPEILATEVEQISTPEENPSFIEGFEFDILWVLIGLLAILILLFIFVIMKFR